MLLSFSPKLEKKAIAFVISDFMDKVLKKTFLSLEESTISLRYVLETNLNYLFPNLGFLSVKDLEDW